ncbi:MAG: hypothetical protein UX91_C0011G0008 [Candidatus Amesbacteria bacterium GW2011_GWB1_47_19]|nr:MAG: hypothetical protein UW51_C0009G0011 [Candidatus Amesbacteria bacterium GW2011_GWA1_44_24]KKU30827.1 MAG: hypothetical protein UX46_C0011G0008 [Candidatus Amesbacteria bacterium GW2011_GWC1_46_24]KKU66525.1 MAG: hypothetical protein UX91_C0011G0008 [Candidatus Amesbacteria bacterium GW2011_GWB1_47_19]OGD06534.1 MAG: hypothetical protein A2379_00170 [Candidatus Amesbacteria bacterium RIFOXYB1_FULL_47_13]HBC72926.1 hypothetical protein [Candidatus Amesbacteria bacterium]
MKCPDCQSELDGVSVTGMDESYRCGNCGGFWVQGWVVNRVAEEGVRTKLEPKKAGKAEVLVRNCPTDGTGLFKPEGGEAFPPEAGVYKCHHCNWWWVAGDDLFALDEAYKARRTYFRLWQKKQNWATWALPVVSVLVLAIGLAGGVYLNQYRARVGVGAGADIRDFTAVYLEQGEAKVSFRSSTETLSVEYRLKNDTGGWAMAETTLDNGVYTSRLLGIIKGQEYTIRAGGREYTFKAI